MFAESLAFAALVVVPLAQVPLVAYLSKYVALDGDADRPDPTDGYVTYGTQESRPDANAMADADADAATGIDADDGRTCPACGRPVAAAYDYCGHCTRRVPDRGGPR